MIGENIKKYRKVRKLKQGELGKLLGVSAAMVSQWERSERNPKDETIQRIAEALKVTVSDLLWEENNFFYLDVLKKAGTTRIEPLANMMGITYERCLNLLTEYEEPTDQEREKIRIITGLSFEEFLAPVERDYGTPDDIDDRPRQSILKESLTVAFDQLNPQGQEKAVESVELLTKVPEYKK